MTSVTTKPDSSQPAAETAVYLFDNCRHLKLHPAEASLSSALLLTVANTPDRVCYLRHLNIRPARGCRERGLSRRLVGTGTAATTDLGQKKGWRNVRGLNRRANAELDVQTVMSS